MYRCTTCGNEVLPPPGAAPADTTCRFCGGTVAPVLRPAPRPARAGSGLGTVVWVLAATAALLGGGFLLKRLTSPTGTQALIGGNWIPAGGVAAPITARPVAVARRGAVLFTMTMADARGRTVRAVRVDGSRPPAPRITVLGPDGQAVYQARLKYG